MNKQTEIDMLKLSKERIESRIAELESDVTPIKLKVGRTGEEIVIPTNGRQATQFLINGRISFWYDALHEKWRISTPIATQVQQIQ